LKFGEKGISTKQEGLGLPADDKIIGKKKSNGCYSFKERGNLQGRDTSLGQGTGTRTGKNLEKSEETPF